MTPKEAIQVLRNLLNAAPVKLLLNTPDICAAEQALQALDEALKKPDSEPKS